MLLALQDIFPGASHCAVQRGRRADRDRRARPDLPSSTPCSCHCSLALRHPWTTSMSQDAVRSPHSFDSTAIPTHTGCCPKRACLLSTLSEPFTLHNVGRLCTLSLGRTNRRQASQPLPRSCRIDKVVHGRLNIAPAPTGRPPFTLTHIHGYARELS
jgi:hypothetical protein